MSAEILYAMTADGVRLPIIDVTHPAFAVSISDKEITDMSERFLLDAAQMHEKPPAFREALQQSPLGKALIAARGSYLSGIATYQMKLGPDNFGADAHPIDRSIAASFPAFMARVRLQEMARLLADGIAQAATANPSRHVCLVSIGGGPASDCWNALLVLRKEQPGLLDDRKVVITVLDIDEQGPIFGKRAIEALCAPRAPLAGVKIEFHARRFDWSQPEELEVALIGLDAANMSCAVSSEGGLFEYGSDEEVAANLKVLHRLTASEATVAGSVTRADERMQATQENLRIATRPRSIETFQSLAEEAGWRLQTVLERPFTYHIRLAKA